MPWLSSRRGKGSASVALHVASRSIPEGAPKRRPWMKADLCSSAGTAVPCSCLTTFAPTAKRGGFQRRAAGIWSSHSLGWSAIRFLTQRGRPWRRCSQTIPLGTRSPVRSATPIPALIETDLRAAITGGFQRTISRPGTGDGSALDREEARYPPTAPRRVRGRARADPRDRALELLATRPSRMARSTAGPPSS